MRYSLREAVCGRLHVDSLAPDVCFKPGILAVPRLGPEFNIRVNDPLIGVYLT